MKRDVLVHVTMFCLSAVILIFNFHNVFGNLEASLVATTWVTFTAINRQNKKIDAQHEATREHITALHNEVKNQNKEN